MYIGPQPRHTPRARVRARGCARAGREMGATCENGNHSRCTGGGPSGRGTSRGRVGGYRRGLPTDPCGYVFGMCSGMSSVWVGGSSKGSRVALVECLTSARVCLEGYATRAPEARHEPRGRGSMGSGASWVPEYVSRAPRACPTPRGAGVRARGAGVGVLLLEGLALEVEGVALESSRGSNWRGHLWRAGSASSFSEAPGACCPGVRTGWIESGPISPVGINPEGATSAPQYLGR
jgi:hypothetical protein